MQDYASKDFGQDDSVWWSNGQKVINGAFSKFDDEILDGHVIGTLINLNAGRISLYSDGKFIGNLVDDYQPLREGEWFISVYINAKSSVTFNKIELQDEE